MRRLLKPQVTHRFVGNLRHPFAGLFLLTCLVLLWGPLIDESNVISREYREKIKG